MIFAVEPKILESLTPLSLENRCAPAELLPFR